MRIYYELYTVTLSCLEKAARSSAATRKLYRMIRTLTQYSRNGNIKFKLVSKRPKRELTEEEIKEKMDTERFARLMKMWKVNKL